MVSEFSIIVGVPVEDILGRSRERMTVDARHLYWRMLRENKQFSMTAIAKLNERTPATVMHGLKKADEFIAQNDKWMCGMWEKVKEIR